MVLRLRLAEVPISSGRKWASLVQLGFGETISAFRSTTIKLISYFAFSNKYTAFNFEKYRKSGSGRAFLKRHIIINPS